MDRANKYLMKIAEDLPLRSRVEVIIRRPSDGKVLVTENIEKGSGKRWIGLPGGGAEDHGDPLKACESEALEEVGIRIDNVRPLGHSHISMGMTKKENRHLQFSGAKTEWYVADFAGEDKSLYGSAGDAAHYSWRTPQEAHKLFKAQGKVYPGGVKAMRDVKNMRFN